jgi:hypothetical protein
MQKNYNSVTIAQSDTTVYDPPLEGIVICAAGTLTYEDGNGTHELVVPAAVAEETVTALPFIFPVRIRRVLEATTIGDADLMGLK